MSTLLIQNGHLVDPVAAIDAPYDLLLRDGVVAAVELPGILTLADTVFNASGLCVAPGLVDIHVHLREPGQTWKETIATGTAAAAAGGFTSVVAMPNTLPVNDSPATMAWMLAHERGARMRVFAMAAATISSAGDQLSDFSALAQAGALGFTDDGKPILSDSTMRAALLAAGRAGRVLSQHAEDPRLSNGALINDGSVAFRLGLRGYPAEAEWTIVQRDIRLLEEIERTEKVRAHLHVQHVSTEGAVAAVREAKRRGLHVTCEAAPHHFTLTDAAIGDYDTNAKMNPPLRAEADRQALIAGLLDGTVDAIATDHAPHARHEKEQEFERAPNGITGLETALGLAMRILHREHGMPLARIIRLMSANPAAIVKLTQAGSLKTGNWGDLILFDPKVEWTYAADQSLSKSKNSPFDATPMLGRVRTTVVGGKIVYENPTR